VKTNMHRAKPSLKEGMQSWLYTLWSRTSWEVVCTYLCRFYINEKWHSRELFPTVFVSIFFN
jgi:hypothetical protein